MPFAVKVFLVLLVVMGIAGGACWAWINGVASSMSLDEKDEAGLNEVLVEQDEGFSSTAPFYVLVMGSDAREDLGGSRSDAIMLVRADVSMGVVTIISIPRDTMVYNENCGIEKINASYNDGPAATVSAVSAFAGVDISHYVEVDFSGLEQVVDALGGVTVDIPEDSVAGNGGMGFSEGEQVLNGEEALAYARERYTVTGGDSASPRRSVRSRRPSSVRSWRPVQQTCLASSPSWRVASRRISRLPRLCHMQWS